MSLLSTTSPQVEKQRGLKSSVSSPLHQKQIRSLQETAFLLKNDALQGRPSATPSYGEREEPGDTSAVYPLPREDRARGSPSSGGPSWSRHFIAYVR